MTLQQDCKASNEEIKLCCDKNNKNKLKSYSTMIIEDDLEEQQQQKIENVDKNSEYPVNVVFSIISAFVLVFIIILVTILWNIYY